tara:strand:- start:45 stop:410 length:366 start_codon:yes stop_codon:yes gene_type:complete
MTTLENKDYLSILSFYNLKTPKRAGKIDYKKVEEMAERKLADKLCRCIKKVHKSRKNKKESEARAVAICSESVIKRKGLKYNGFKCKKRARFLSKTKKNRLYKVKGKGKKRSNKTRKRNKR